MKQHEKLIQSSGILFARNRLVEYVGQWMSHEWEVQNNYKLGQYIEGLSPRYFDVTLVESKQKG